MRIGDHLEGCWSESNIPSHPWYPMCLGIGMLLRRILGIGTLRRTWRTAPLVLLLIAVFLIYHTSVVNWTGFRPAQEDQKNKSVMRNRTVLLKHPGELVPLLEAWHDHSDVSEQLLVASEGKGSFNLQTRSSRHSHLYKCNSRYYLKVAHFCVFTVGTVSFT